MSGTPHTVRRAPFLPWMAGVGFFFTLAAAAVLLATTPNPHPGWHHELRAINQRSLSATLTRVRQLPAPGGTRDVAISYTLHSSGPPEASHQREMPGLTKAEATWFLNLRPGDRFRVWQRLDTGGTSLTPWPKETVTAWMPANPANMALVLSADISMGVALVCVLIYARLNPVRRIVI